MEASWIDVAPVAELSPGQAKVVTVDGSPVAVINLDGELHALSDMCTHEDWPIVGSGADLEELLVDGELVCPHHGARFCVRTGDAMCAPAYEPLETYEVRVQDGVIQVKPE